MSELNDCEIIQSRSANTNIYLRECQCTCSATSRLGVLHDHFVSSAFGQGLQRHYHFVSRSEKLPTGSAEASERTLTNAEELVNKMV